MNMPEPEECPHRGCSAPLIESRTTGNGLIHKCTEGHESMLDGEAGLVPVRVVTIKRTRYVGGPVEVIEIIFKPDTTLKDAREIMEAAEAKCRGKRPTGPIHIKAP